MAIQLIEECFPETAAYINQVFDRDGRERGGHHNYVIEQRCCNFSQTYDTTIADSDAKTLREADKNFVSYLRELDVCRDEKGNITFDPR